MTAPSDAPVCRRCHRPVIRNRDRYEVFERMHWSCFHYEFEHGAGVNTAEADDPDIACRDPACPARAFDDQAPPDWNAGRPSRE